MNPDPESIDLEAHPELEPEFAPEPDDQGARHAASEIPEPPAWADELDEAARFLYPAREAEADLEEELEL